MTTVTSPTIGDVPGMVRRGVDNVRRNPMAHLISAAIVFAVFGSARVLATASADRGQVIAGLAIDVVGSVIATVVALPWFRTALAGERDSAPGGSPLDGIGAMTVGAIFFWAGVLLGLRYLFGIPSIVVMVMYAFFGFAIADGQASGLHALGTSVRIGQGRRTVVGVVGLVLGFLNMLAAVPLALEATPLTIAISAILLGLTTSVSMGTGAHLYDRLLQSEEDHANT